MMRTTLANLQGNQKGKVDWIDFDSACNKWKSEVYIQLLKDWDSVRGKQGYFSEG